MNEYDEALREELIAEGRIAAREAECDDHQDLADGFEWSDGGDE